MSLAPLLQAPPVIQVHVAAAVAAFVLGIIQFAAPKGTLPHRTLGWIWVGLMAIAAGSSFSIHAIRQFGPFSMIHGLSIFSLVMLVLGVTRARQHKVTAHKWTMFGIFAGALIVAGAFAFMPGRIMHQVVVGGR